MNRSLDCLVNDELYLWWVPRRRSYDRCSLLFVSDLQHLHGCRTWLVLQARQFDFQPFNVGRNTWEIGLGWINIYYKIKYFIFMCNWKVGVYEVWKRWPPWNWKWMALIINVTSTLARHRGKDNVFQISTTSRGRIQDFFVEGVPTLQESTNIQFITFSKNTWNRENCGSYWECALAPSVRHCKPYVIFGI